MAYQNSYQCDICSVQNAKLYRLNELEKVLTKKLFQLSGIQVIIQDYPAILCEHCLQRLVNLKLLLKDILLLRSNVENTMKSGDNRGNTGEEHSNRFDCRCSKCQDKYGGLPLLVEGIEKSCSREQQPGPSTSRASAPECRRKEMKCHHCEKTFTHKGDLNKHIRTHTGEQPFTCSICHRKFAHTSNLARHARLHTGSRPFVCDTCNKSFSRKDKYDLHCRSKYCQKK